eukprot:3128134-Rhodomonas_salina.1
MAHERDARRGIRARVEGGRSGVEDWGAEREGRERRCDGGDNESVEMPGREVGEHKDDETAGVGR